MKKEFLLSFLILLFCSSSIVAQSATRVRFAKGKATATVSGTIEKNQGKCFVLAAMEGQELTARLKSKDGKVQFPFHFGAGYYRGGVYFNIPTQNGDNEVCIEHFLEKKATTFTLTISIR